MSLIGADADTCPSRPWKKNTKPTNTVDPQMGAAAVAGLARQSIAAHSFAWNGQPWSADSAGM
jgi:hypothetical protein